MVWEVKNVKNFDSCLCSSYRDTISFRFVLYLVHELVGMMSPSPMFNLGSKSILILILIALL